MKYFLDHCLIYFRSLTKNSGHDPQMTEKKKLATFEAIF